MWALSPTPCYLSTIFSGSCWSVLTVGSARFLVPGQEPKATFLLTDGDQVEAAYAYCNIHGFWASQR